mgnify:CR=1 FL=1
MREISCNAIISSIKEMCIQATHYLSDDMKSALYKGVEKEESPLGRQILEQLCENLKIAGEDMIPICQDTGMAVVFVEIGQEVHIDGGQKVKKVYVKKGDKVKKGDILLKYNVSEKELDLKLQTVRDFLRFTTEKSQRHLQMEIYNTQGDTQMTKPGL